MSDSPQGVMNNDTLDPTINPKLDEAALAWYKEIAILYDKLFFPGPLAFWKKAVERVRSEKNILNR